MARKRANILKKSTQDLLTAADTIIRYQIPDSVSKSDPSYMVEVAYATGDWAVASPQTTKVRKLEDQVNRVISTMQPAAIAITIYEKEKDVFARLVVKFTDDWIPAHDGDEPGETSKAGVLEDDTDSLHGLGMLGKMQMQNNSLSYQNKIDNLIRQHETTIKLNDIENTQVIREFKRTIDDLKAKNKELTEDLEETTSILEQYESETDGNTAEAIKTRNALITTGALGLLQKFVPEFDATPLMGLLAGSPEAIEQGDQVPMNANVELETAENDILGGERGEDITAIIVFLNALPEETYRKLITIIKRVHKDNDIANTIYDLITERQD